MNEVKVYKGQGVSVQFNLRRCIHAAECVHGLPRVFDPQARPWIQPGQATADEVVAVVARCPTGALHASYDDGRAAEAMPARNELRIVADGPHHLRGDIEIRDDSGTALARETRMALCRCGASGNKPYCDNSHVGSGFKDEVHLQAGRDECALFVSVESDNPLPALVRRSRPDGRSCKRSQLPGRHSMLSSCGRQAASPAT